MRSVSCTSIVGVPTGHQTRLGQRGEELACRELRRRGYVILARGFRTRHGEIDIIARDGDTLVFIEVKTRSTARFGGALAAVTPAKQRRVAAMAESYVSRMRWGERPCRFDVVAVDGDGRGGKAVVTVVVDAFGVSPAG